MNKIVCAVVCLLVCTSCVGGFNKDIEKPGWETLVTGKSLDGWIKRGGDATYKAKDGVVTGTTGSPGSPNTFLCTQRLYGNFILELEFKVDPNMNSGIQIRSESHAAYQNGRVHGYQVEIDPSDRAWTGGIYDEGRRGWLFDLKGRPAAQAAFKQGEWNKIRVEAIGDSIKTWVNGVPASDLKDSFTEVGFIALQVHSTKSTKPLHVMWRNIRIMDLDLGKSKTFRVDPYMGDWKSADGKVVAQVMSLGRGKYRANLLPRFDTRDKPLWVMNGRLVGDEIMFKSGDWWGKIDDGTFTGGNKGKQKLSFKMDKIKRVSTTLGARPPASAEILFDGSNLDQWETLKGQPAKWKLVHGDAMEIVPDSGSIITKKKFRDAKFHIEFRTPFKPNSFGQARGNSGVYLQGRYEIQVLDSYGLEGLDNECGGIYKVAEPNVNMCLPPLQWQTYDIEYRAPRFDSDGKKIKNARVTVLQNGVAIHKDLELPGPTAGGISKKDSSMPEPLLLQAHKNFVQYRNIWAVEL